MTPTFCLVEEPWIPSRLASGESKELGLRQVLIQSHEIVEISDPSPLVTSALLRILLVLTYRVLDGPKDKNAWEHHWDSGRFVAQDVEAYLDAWRHRFDLFHPKHPFFQVGGFTVLNSKNEPENPRPISVLRPEVASGNNATLFDHSLDAIPVGLSPPEAARNLVATQAWSLGGGKGPTSNLGPHPYSSHASLAGALQVFASQDGLYRFLLANVLLEAYREAPLDQLGTPIWERPGSRPLKKDATIPDGLLDWMTFPARCIRLLPESVGEPIEVKQVYLAPGWVPPKDIRDPHTSWRPKSSGDGLTPVGLQPGRAVWRDSASLFAWRESEATDQDRLGVRPAIFRQVSEDPFRKTLGQNDQFEVLTFGLANDKGKALAWSRNRLPVSLRVASDPHAGLDLVNTLQAIETAWKELRSASRRLLNKALSTKTKAADRKEVDRLCLSLLAEDEFWSQVGQGFEPYMRQVSSDPEEAHRSWMNLVRATAFGAFQRVSDRCPVSFPRRVEAHSLAFPPLASKLKQLQNFSLE